MEIERKFLIDPDQLPFPLTDLPSHHIEQGYLCTEPVVRIRREDNDYILTYKSKGLMIREEYNLPLTQEAYVHLRTKIDGKLIQKRRYLIPAEQGLTVELDVFEGELAPLCLAEVEFPDEDSARSYIPPEWFQNEVTYDPSYHNSSLSK
ncbi:CYTH domain-containing protein [Mediterraneibacter massiliensis]|uniref:CYTH domain-containing protein n=1 Tax=Mediterraneibacter massiliensis TaxID=1720300 RepID=UPI0024AD0144|nr:CYTH domain-containing protein [Mediterraneibacter massiliensis]